MPQVETFILQNAVTANGNGVNAEVEEFLSAQVVEIAESAGGTATVTLQGTLDGTNWYSLGFQQTDATASLTRSVSAISVLANSRHVYQLLDPYAQIRAVVSGVAGGANVTVKLFAVV